MAGLAAYGVALLAFLFGLERLFIAERDDARADVAAQRRALETYAERSFKQLLRERLEVAEPEFDRAVKDPYLDDSGLRFVVDGELLLPRLEGASVRKGLARGQYESLHEGEYESPFASADELEPVLRRLGLVSRVREASETCAAAALATSTQQLLGDEALYQLPIWFSAPVKLFLVESLSRCEAVNPDLLRRLLRDGMPLRDSGELSEGFQRLLLRRRSTLSADDFRFLCERTIALSKRLSVDDTDFALRCKSGATFEGWPRAFGEGELVEPGWFYRTRGSVTRGVRVEVPAALEAIRAEMAERGLLAGGDVLGAGVQGGALEVFRLRLSSPALEELERRADRRLSAKSGLLVAFAALAVVLAVGAVVSQRRKQRYLELKSDFVAAVSHELRTPLASLRVMAETLEHRLEGEARARDYPRRIVAEADALSGLVENILSFNRLDKDRWVAHPRPLALAEFQKGLEEEARAYGLAKVSVTFEGFDSQRLDADPELLKLLFSNLLRNACRYNANDPVQVRFAAATENGGLAIRVFDNGVGIPPEAHQKVFNEFERLKGQGGRGGPGSGLGLSLCRRIMELHRGTLSLEASSASGSTFLMRFPLA